MDPNRVRTPHILITGGGTGGHLFPGIAVAREFLARDPESRILFVGTGKAIETEVLAREGFEHRVISARGFKGMGLFGKLSALMTVPRGIASAWEILKSFAPDLVVGVGGYSAGPVAAAAWMQGIPVVLHEQNAVPGLTNRTLSRIARRIYVSLPESAQGFPPDKVLITGNPVRPELLRATGVDTAEERVFTILVAGGSQGAKAINRAVVDLLPLLDWPNRVRFLHQTGLADEAEVREAYRDAGIQAVTGAFFTDMGQKYRRSDLVICRAGATTVAELTCLGKPAIFIPYPFAADNHQEKNALGLVRAGAAEMIRESDLSPGLLAERIRDYRKHPEKLNAMAGKAGALGRPDAANVIVTDCLRLIWGVDPPADSEGLPSSTSLD
ncbi:MAG: undecaprenyldiphospho-muramoylpentapeptide beta-N-acetylglucosaminyltransferase [Desulfobacterales bacterium]